MWKNWKTVSLNKTLDPERLLSAGVQAELMSQWETKNKA